MEKNIFLTLTLGYDYGNRAQASLVKGYYKICRRIFTDEMMKAVEKNTTFDEKSFSKNITALEWNGTPPKEKHSYPRTPHWLANSFIK